MSSRKLHIFAVDDDSAILLMISRYFESEGFRVSTAESAQGLVERIHLENPDVLLIDTALPGEDGLQVARDVRSQSDIGIIMLTARFDVVDHIVALELGADDYVVKPFNLRELHARIKTVLRRARPDRDKLGIQHCDEVIRFDGWSLSAERRELRNPSNREVPLTTREFDLLLAFASRPGRVFDRDTLIQLTRRGGREVFDRTVDAQVARLRKKIEAAPHQPA